MKTAQEFYESIGPHLLLKRLQSCQILLDPPCFYVSSVTVIRVSPAFFCSRKNLSVFCKIFLILKRCLLIPAFFFKIEKKVLYLPRDFSEFSQYFVGGAKLFRILSRFFQRYIIFRYPARCFGARISFSGFFGVTQDFFHLRRAFTELVQKFCRGGL